MPTFSFTNNNDFDVQVHFTTQAFKSGLSGGRDSRGGFPKTQEPWNVFSTFQQVQNLSLQ
jgi:hypothetical protein